jgi:hypothetical protein
MSTHATDKGIKQMIRAEQSKIDKIIDKIIDGELYSTMDVCKICNINYNGFVIWRANEKYRWMKIKNNYYLNGSQLKKRMDEFISIGFGPYENM